MTSKRNKEWLIISHKKSIKLRVHRFVHSLLNCIEGYVIIDDQHFDFQDDSKLWENYLDTECRGIEHSILASKHQRLQQWFFWIQ